MLYTYAFIGLTPSERALLNSIFNLEGGRDKALVRVRQADEADLLVVNGDDSAVVERLRQANPQALMVLVGQPPGSAPVNLPVLSRPLELTSVMRVLSGLDWPREPRNPPTDFDLTFSFTSVSAPTELPPGAPAPDALSALPGGGFDSQPADADADVMVVVGPNRNKPPTLSLGMRKLGYRVRVIEGADQALRAMEWYPALFVFMDQASLGSQLMLLARALSAQRRLADGPPHLVVVAHHDSLFDRLRARLLGCTWMVAPVHGRRLAAFFERRGLKPSKR